MHFKREISTSVTDLHVNTVSDSIKRLAISHDGHPEPAMNIRNPNSIESIPILTVMSSAQDDFRSKYQLIAEIGKGGFSTVYQCRSKASGLDYAVKVVDLRPLRLRERFNPARLRREVDIMKRLHHPNIIQFVDVFEDADHLMMIMEFCPGQELFDVILNRKFFQEEDAKPIFAQIARALFYLHSLNILHRDVKPENVLISSIPDPVTGGLVAKLLDFGLSKNAGTGSAAKTFVGTPCYVAPEVEYTSKGLGGTYSFPADCWSLGAVLYVMLVARFPEFEQDQTGKVVVKMTPALWGNVSNEAKDLIRSLMNTNPAARLTMARALMHPWLGRFGATQEEISRTAVSSYDLNRSLQEEEARLEALEHERARHRRARSGAQLNSIGEMDADIPKDVEITAGGVEVHQQAMVVRVPNGVNDAAGGRQGGGDQQIQLAPLLHLQRSIATCFDEVHASYKEMPEVASDIRQGAALCREQLTESTKMLRKVEQTAAAVLNMFPDLELAVEEGEPALAAEFFGMVKEWVAELREMVTSTQGINKASMYKIQQIVERSAIGLVNRQKQKAAPNTINVPKKLLDTVIVKLGLGDKYLLENGQSTKGATAPEDNVELDANHVMELFMSLFGNSSGGSSGPGGGTQVASRQSVPPRPDPYFGRVFSIDSDSHSVDSSSSPEHVLSKQNSDEANAAVGRAEASQQPHSAALNNFLRRTSHNTNAGSVASGLSLPSQDGTISIHKKDSNCSSQGGGISVDSPMVETSTQHTGDRAPAETFQQTPQQQERRDRGGTEATIEMVVEDAEDRQDSYDSTISFDTNQHEQQQRDERGGNTGSKKYPLMLENIDVASEGSSMPQSPGTGAAARLSEALQKLRQVDDILEQLSVFWANTEVVLDLLTKKGQHVEHFIGFATKPRLMARFRERMEEYKRFWENVSMMCSNYIAGVQTTNDTQRMYGFLESDSVSSLTGTPTMPSAKTNAASGNSSVGKATYTTSATARSGGTPSLITGTTAGGKLNFNSPLRS